MAPSPSAKAHDRQRWDWAFGQTPEFTYTLDNTFTWGTVVSFPAL